MGLLIESLDPVFEPDVEAAWSEEIERRVAEIEAGTVELILGRLFARNCSASLNENLASPHARAELRAAGNWYYVRNRSLSQIRGTYSIDICIPLEISPI